MVPLVFNIPGVHNLGIDGLSLESFVDCSLHTIDLGLAQRFVATSFRDMLCANIFSLPVATRLEKLYAGMDGLKRRCKLYYKNHDRTHRKKITRMKQWDVSKLGPLDFPCLKAKGAETKELVPFTTALLAEIQGQLGLKGTLLTHAGQALVDYYEVMRSEPRVLGLAPKIKLMELAINHILCFRNAGGKLVDKHHNMLHLSANSSLHGNPAKYATYMDEYDNGLVAAVGVTCHANTFYESLWEKIETIDRLLHESIDD